MKPLIRRIWRELWLLLRTKVCSSGGAMSILLWVALVVDLWSLCNPLTLDFQVTLHISSMGCQRAERPRDYLESGFDSAFHPIESEFSDKACVQHPWQLGDGQLYFSWLQQCPGQSPRDCSRLAAHSGNKTPHQCGMDKHPDWATLRESLVKGAVETAKPSMASHGMSLFILCTWRPSGSITDSSRWKSYGLNSSGPLNSRT